MVTSPQHSRRLHPPEYSNPVLFVGTNRRGTTTESQAARDARFVDLFIYYYIFSYIIIFIFIIFFMFIYYFYLYYYFYVYL